MTKTVDAYFEQLAPPQRKVLRQVRALVKKAAPGAEEVLSYRMPAVRLEEGIVVFFAAWKEHWSLYPVSAELNPGLQKLLAKYEQSKGTVKFPLDAPVPAKVVERIVKARVAAVLERAAMKKAKKALK